MRAVSTGFRLVLATVSMLAVVSQVSAQRWSVSEDDSWCDRDGGWKQRRHCEVRKTT